MSERPAVFLDLSGTLVAPVVVARLQDLVLIEDTAEHVARLCRAGFLCPVVTVQSRIEKGLFSEAEFRTWFVDLARRMAASGATLLGPYVCPHRFRTPCGCKKPQTLLHEQAAADHDIDLRASYVVGDSTADVEAARRFGGCGCFLWSPYGAEGGEHAPGLASFTGRSIGEVVDWILSRETAEQADAPDEARLPSRTPVEPRGFGGPAVAKRRPGRCHVAVKTVAQKARVKPGTTIAVINRVPGIVESLGLPADVAFVKPADAQLVFLFVRTRAELEARMPPAVAALGPASAIWVFFRKGSRDAGLDMNRNTVWELAERLDLRPLGLVGIDEMWSAFRLRRRG